jgi:hypothetical protein
MVERRSAELAKVVLANDRKPPSPAIRDVHCRELAPLDLDKLGRAIASPPLHGRSLAANVLSSPRIRWLPAELDTQAKLSRASNGPLSRSHFRTFSGRRVG